MFFDTGWAPTGFPANLNLCRMDNSIPSFVWVVSVDAGPPFCLHQQRPFHFGTSQAS